MKPAVGYCNNGRHQVASNYERPEDRHGSYLVYQEDPMPWTQLGKGVKRDASSSLNPALDSFLFWVSICFEWTANMFRNGLYYLLAGAAVPHVLSSVLQPTPPMGTYPPSSSRTSTDLL